MLGRGQSRTLFVEKEAMAPHVVDGFTYGTAPSSRIHHGNPEFTNVDGLEPMFAFGPRQVVYPRVLDSMAYSGCVLRTALSGRIPEFTYIGGPIPPINFSHR